MAVTPEVAVKFTKITNIFMCIWPTSKSKKKLIDYFYEFLWWFSLIDAFTVLLTLIASIHKYFDQTLIAMKSAIFMSGVVNFLIKIIITRIHRKHYQMIAMELDSFLNSVDQNGRKILQHYVDKSWFFHAYMTSSYYFVSVLFLMGPLFLPEKLPNDAVYPFSIEPLWIFIIVYVQDITVGFQISAGLVIDCQAALYLWFLGARFEILVSELKYITNENELGNFVKMHQSLIQYAELVLHSVSGIAFTTVTMTIVGMVLGSIILASNQPTTVKIQFTVLVLSASINIFICARAADNLIEASSTVMREGLYDFQWHTMSSDAKKIIQIMLLRTQRPITISLSGFVSQLSHQYYASFISSAFSYFTTLRLMVQLDG